MQRSRLARSSRSAMLFLVLGIVSVVATLGGGWLYLRPEPAPPPPKPEPPPKPVPVVLTAANDLNIGRLITTGDLAWKPVRDGSVLSTHMLQGKTNEADVIGSVVRRAVFKGMPLNWSAIVRPGDHGFLAAALKPDHRAVTIRVDAATSEAALIYPGDHVDVILTAQLDGRDGRGTNTVTATILEYIRVVAVNRQVESSVSGSGSGIGGRFSRNAASTVTLELPPPDAERLILAKNKGTISLAMRSLTDVRRRENRTPTAFENLLPLPTPLEPEPIPAPNGPIATTAAPVPPTIPVPGAFQPGATALPPPPVPPEVMEPPGITVKVFRGGEQEDVTVAQ